MNRVVDTLGPEGFGAYEVEWPGPVLRRVSRAADTYLVPGFVDIHTHGAFGIDFMSATSEDMKAWCSKLESLGYEGFLPTTVTASVAAVKRSLSVLPDDPMILGVHLEGPFISPKHPGAQPKEFIIDPPVGASEWDEVLEDPRLKVMTLAPERPGALDLILRLFKRNVVVSMGHTDATYDQARHGFEFGCIHSTHTYNAMRGLHHREAGMVGYALSQSGLSCELIYDRLHVCKEAASLLIRNKPADRIIAVSDSSMAAGLPAGTKIEMWGYHCVVGRGEVRLDDGTLAGSAISLLDAFRNLLEDFGPEVAIRATSLNPRKSLHMTGQPCVWLVFDRKLNLVERKLNV